MNSDIDEFKADGPKANALPPSVPDCNGDPPPLAEFILAAITKPSHREGLLQCEEEVFRRNLIRKGAKRARYLYWSGMLWNVWPLMGRALRRALIVGAFILASNRLYR